METLSSDRPDSKRDSREAPPEPATVLPLKRNHTRVPNAMSERRDLSDSAVRVWIALEQFAWRSNSGDTCYPSNRSIGSKAGGKSPAAVKRALAELQARGLVRCEPVPQREENDYTGRTIVLLNTLPREDHEGIKKRPGGGGSKMSRGRLENEPGVGSEMSHPPGSKMSHNTDVIVQTFPDSSSDALNSLADSLGSRSVAMSPQGSPPVPLSPAAAETTEGETIAPPADGGEQRQRQRQEPERDPDGPPPRGGPPPAPGGKPARPAPRSGLSEGRRLKVNSMCEGRGGAGASEGPPPAPADDDPTELARGDAPPQEPEQVLEQPEDPNALMTAFIRAELAPGAPTLESVTTQATAEVLACLTPTERSAYDSATPGKQKNLVNLLRLGMEDVVRSELATIAASMKRPRIEPETAPLPALLAYLRSTDDPAVLTTTAARLAAETGDGPQSWPHWERVAADVRSGTLRPDDILRPLAYATDPASQVGKPAAYVARSIKITRHQLQTAGALA